MKLHLIIPLTLCMLLPILSVGCESPDSSIDPFAQRMAYLERGHAQGHVTASTDGTVGVGSTQSFWAGAPKSIFTFEGDVDYSSPVDRETMELFVRQVMAAVASESVAETTAPDAAADAAEAVTSQPASE